MRTPSVVASAAALSLVLAWGCDSSDDRLGYETAGPAPVFGAADAGADPDAGPGALYCATSECSFGFTTCASSRFLCDVNLLSDRDNCGACGNACPKETNNSTFLCIDGACVMDCKTSPQHYDCDGIVDNGCETWPTNDEHCGACNVKCDPSTDPTQACAQYFAKNGDWVFQCGCPSDLTFCDARCVDTNNDDDSCGACGASCNPDGGPQPTPANAYYGCASQECGAFKCKALYLDCDGQRANGCEVMAVTDDNCGACGIQCDAGTRCLLDPEGVPRCMCDPGTSLCVTGRDEERAFDRGYCADFGNDNDNCGGCGVKCKTGSPFVLPFPGAREYCVGGSCALRCVEGNADCNHSLTDGCETDTFSDPRNCGGCGIECDLAAGQACAGGRCMLAPCDDDDDDVETAR
ncbi:MAG: hypothetical protein KF850_12020 [Labilithrix sp.]|nr:hypothetical protein [Labilithrix sp.]MBX3212754.1 hypothetical protein [Labilithrix sp.]